ncbi:MAG: baseplate J/gp47 family protein [Clostridiales bacterium]|nr:baseplate J/gp47 family protein [Clostridiales bacterium]
MKTVDEIYREMLAAFAEETGMELTGTSDLAVRLYAVAAQVNGLYIQGDWVLRQCFPQTAEGDYLDRHAALRALTRREAAKAQGVIRFSVGEAMSADRPIQAGVVCMTAGLVRFETTQEAVLKAGELWTDVPARAVEAGSAGNVAAETVRFLSVAPVGVSACTNPAGFAGGADQESDEALRQRVLESFKRLPNGANAAFYEQGALSFEGVAAAKALARNRGTGTVDVVVSTATGLPSAELLAALTAYLGERREIAVDVGVLAPAPVAIDVTVGVAPQPGVDSAGVLDAAEHALRGYFDGTLLGQDILRARLGAVIFSVGGVENYTITAPAQDVAISAGQLPTLGTLRVEVMS